ncbi:MAG: molecular chaperone DnaK [Acidobacteriota bacterium]
MGRVVGIDLGTTYSCLAYLEGIDPKVIPNLEGLPTSPSMVSFTPMGEQLIGTLAMRQALTNPDKTIYAVKRLMGKKFSSSEIQSFISRIPYKLIEAPNGDILIDLGSNHISPQEISSMIIRYLKRCAESYFGEKVTEAVITVPAHFDDHQRQATKDAAKIAGLDVLRIINEPTAASLAFGLEQKKNGTIAVYDFGGGTFDITILEINDGVFHILSTNGDTFLGGEDFDTRIVDWLLEEFRHETGIELVKDKFALQRIRESAEKAKRELSYTFESEIHLPFITSDKSGSKHMKKTLTRRNLEELTIDLVKKTFPKIEQALDDSRLAIENIDCVILVGGQSRMPLIKKMLKEFFRKEPIDSINPDEAVAIGAAIQSGILEGRMSDIVLLLDVTPISLGIETENDRFVKIIEKNTTIPTKKSTAFTTVEDNQRRVRIHVLQGEEETASQNTSLAVFDLVGIEFAPAGVPQIDVTFEIDADGLVRVSAKDVVTRREQGIEVRPSSGLSAHEVNQIIKRTQEETEVDDQDETGLL